MAGSVVYYDRKVFVRPPYLSVLPDFTRQRINHL
jgi:hypothetical protein